jgi:serine/threonine protein kinase/WD40 repeat protein
MIAQTLGQFEILEKIGEGGMGVVYKALDRHLDRLVAIKTLQADKVADADRRRRFTQEAKAASALNHPGIVTIYDITEAGGIYFIAMEFVPGRTLDRVITRRGLTLNQTLDYAVQIADALAAAHASGIVHRDLKPANVIVSDHGRIKILDFGLAKLVERDRVQLRDDTPTVTSPATDQEMIIGTAAYMAPEQAEGKPVDPRADIFSFGALLHEMVTGQRAFSGESAIATLTAVLHQEPRPVSEVHEDLPRELERIITRCLRKDPERRCQSMADVKVALRELKDESDSGRLAPIVAAVKPRRRRTIGVFVAGCALLLVAGLAAVLLLRDRGADRNDRSFSFESIPLTTYQGREQQPTFSPDGNSVAFSWNGEAQDNWDIWVKLIGPGAPLRLTTDAAADVSPAWSRDGRSIAFGRINGDRLAVIVVPALGGPERQILETRVGGGVGVGQLFAWSADSRVLIVAAPVSSATPAVLTAVTVATGETRALTTASSRGAGDSLPAVSPDGRRLAFVRRSGVLTGELYIQPLSADLELIGDRQRVGREGDLYHGVAWSADGRSLIVSAGGVGNAALWRVSIDRPDQLQRVSPPGEDCRQPTIALQQSRLAFTTARWDENIWSLPLSGPGEPAGDPVSVIHSTRLDLNAQFSPDGTRIVFESMQSGTHEIWVADRDGRNALQLTSFEGRHGGTPAWSPDGQSIAFDLRNADGRGDIYVMSARGGAARRITDHPADDLVPTWSHDGQWIYFASTRTGVYQIWKVSPHGGEPVQVTQQGGTYAKESLDGQYLYYARTAGTALPSLWRVPVSGGEEVPILRQIASYPNFAVARDGIYFEAPTPGTPLAHNPTFTPFIKPAVTIDFLSFVTGRVKSVIATTNYSGDGLDISPDGRTMLFGQIDSFTEDLMLIENFR